MLSPGWRIKALSQCCRTHNVCVCLYIAYIACGSALLYMKTLYFFLTVLALSAAATVAKIKIRYDAKNSPIRYTWDTCHVCSIVLDMDIR